MQPEEDYLTPPATGAPGPATSRVAVNNNRSTRFMVCIAFNQYAHYMAAQHHLSSTCTYTLLIFVMRNMLVA